MEIELIPSEEKSIPEQVLVGIDKSFRQFEENDYISLEEFISKHLK
jgi:hypothetical protein